MWKINGVIEDSQGRKNEAEFDVNLIVGERWGVCLDVEITPLYCMNCHKQLDGFFKHDGSRYGQVGTVRCNHCGVKIDCVDDDNIRRRLMTYTRKRIFSRNRADNEFILVYSKLYELDNEIWPIIKEKIGYDIIEKHNNETIPLQKVIEEICKEYQIEPDSLEACTTATSGQIKKLPEIVNKWRSLLQYIMGLEDRTSQEYNNKLYTFLSETEFLPKKFIYQMHYEYSYGSATTAQWVIKKLLILRTRIEKNETIEVEVGYLLNIDNFNQWIKELFPDIYDEVKIGCNGSAKK